MNLEPKRILVHVGPHKTGTSSIQSFLHNNSGLLSLNGVKYFSDSLTHKAAMAMARSEYEQAEVLLKDIAEKISSFSEPFVILSHEDFAGQLIGRDASKKVYPRLTKHLRILKRSFRGHHTEFMFFERDERQWLYSCYVQNLRYRTRFWNFQDFWDRFSDDLSWRNRLEKPLQIFGDDLKVVPYVREPSKGIQSVLGHFDVTLPIGSNADVWENTQPTSSQIAILEHINRVSAFPKTAWFSKSLAFRESSENPREKFENNISAWPPKFDQDSECALPSLLQRANIRVPKQECDDILPDVDVLLGPLLQEYLPIDVEEQRLNRKYMQDQSKILAFHFRGKSQLAHLSALVISYLRRDTPHTEKARVLFHRIWSEYGYLLINELSTRWLISSLQTFFDHGLNENQRQIGVAGLFYANVMKIYEGERSIEGREQNAIYDSIEPQTKNLFRGLDRFKLGGTDLMLNVNSLLLEIALKEDVAGILLQELILRTKESETVFSRLDRSRSALGVETENFTDTWCFYEPPKN